MADDTTATFCATCRVRSQVKVTRPYLVEPLFLGDDFQVELFARYWSPSKQASPSSDSTGLERPLIHVLWTPKSQLII